MVRDFLQLAIDGDLAALKRELKGAPYLAKQCDRNRDTALGLAALNNHVECVRLLLSLSNPHIKTVDWGRTPLMLAAQMGAAESVEALLPASDPLLRDTDERSALMLVLKNREHSISRERCLDLLWSRSDLKAEDGVGNSVLMYAAKSGYDDRVRSLLPDRQAKAKNLAGHTELACAIMGGSKQTVQALLPGSDPAAVDRQGNTLLHFAAALESESSLSILQLVMGFVSGLHPNHAGETPLDLAQREESWEKIDLLADALPLNQLNRHLNILGAGWLPRQQARWEKEQLIRVSAKKGSSQDRKTKEDPIARSDLLVSASKAKRI